MPATSEAALKRKRMRSRERKRENTRQWKSKNPEKVREQKTRYGQRNKKKVAQGKRKWQQANVKKVRVQRARYKRRCKDQSKVEKLGKSYELKELWVVLTDCGKSTQPVKEKLPPPPRKRRRGEKSKKYNYNWYEKLRGDPVRYKEYLERRGGRVQRLKKDPVRYKQYREKRNAAQRKRRQKIREDPVLYKEHLEKIRESKQRLKNDPVRYKQHLERNKLTQRKRMQGIREDPLRREDYRKRTIEYEQRRRAKKRKMNRKLKEVVETQVKSCDCGLCIPCKGFETLSWCHHYDHHFVKHKENDEVEENEEEKGYGTEDSDTSVDSALEKELEHMLAQPSDAESDRESEEPLIDELDHLLAYVSDHESDDVMPRHIDRVRTNHRWGVDRIVKHWQENEETERIVHELEEELEDLNTAPHEVSRTYHQFEREDQVEQSRSDYDRSIEVTQELMDELEQFLLN